MVIDPHAVFRNNLERLQGHLPNFPLNGSILQSHSTQYNVTNGILALKTHQYSLDFPFSLHPCLCVHVQCHTILSYVYFCGSTSTIKEVNGSITTHTPQHCPFLLPTTNLFFASNILSLKNTFCKWSHTVCNLLVLTFFFSQPNIFEIRSSCMNQQFAPFYLEHYSTV